jgi:prophage regulatory protein
VFGELPPDCSEDGEPDPAPEPELPSDDTTMLRAKEVARRTGLSLSTLKRKVISGEFPKPMRLSPRRIGWQAGAVRSWLEGLDGARVKGKY